jgi:sugar phosphate permease
VVALPVALGWRALAPLSEGAPPARAGAAGAGAPVSSWGWLRRAPILLFFASGLVLGMVQAAVLSYLPLYCVQALGFDAIGAGFLVAFSQAGGAASRLALGAASDRWLAGRRTLWLALTAAVGATIFTCYAVWHVGTPVLAGLLAFAAGVGAYGWVGIFFIVSAELGGRRASGLLSGIAFASIVAGLLVGPAVFGLLLVRWDSYAAPWTVFAGLAILVALATLLAGPAIDREREVA